MKKILVVAVIWFLPFLGYGAPQLLRADYIFLHKVQSAIGADPNVQVGKSLIINPKNPADTVLAIQVTGANASEKGQALATLLISEKDCYGVVVHLHVLDAQGIRIAPGELPTTFADTKVLYETALADNWYFLEVLSREIGEKPRQIGYDGFVAFRFIAVQYYNDSLGNAIGCGNEVAQNVFADLTQLTAIQKSGVKISMTTERVKVPTRKPWRQRVRDFFSAL